MNNRFDDVYALVRLIPPGRVCTYGAIAGFLGMRGGARLVGWAMNASHALNDVPAHRVVNAQGMLSGKAHFGHPDRMQALLEAEGIQVKNDQVQAFKQVFWDPENSLLL